MGLASLKSQATTRTPAKKKSSIPIVIASDVIASAIKDFRSAKRKEKDAKAEVADAEARMLDEAKSLRVRQSRLDKTNLTSIQLQSGKEHIQFTQKRQFKKMDEEHEDTLRSIVGASNFDKWFTTRTTYSFNGEALASLPNADKIADAIVAALGPHVDLLQVETLIVPTEAYADETTLNEDATHLATKLESEGLAVPYKGSFK